MCAVWRLGYNFTLDKRLCMYTTSSSTTTADSLTSRTTSGLAGHQVLRANRFCKCCSNCPVILSEICHIKLNFGDATLATRCNSTARPGMQHTAANCKQPNCNLTSTSTQPHTACASEHLITTRSCRMCPFRPSDRCPFASIFQCLATK